jgi:hypothetical protein
MICVNQTRPHCVNQMGKSQSKSLAERRGRGTAGYCESALSLVTVNRNKPAPVIFIRQLLYHLDGVWFNP